MKARNIGLIAALAALSGCAAMQTAGDQPVAQKAVYVVPDNGGPGTKPVVLDSEKEQQGGASKLMRIYWFLGGR
jgi:hypothetical protein